MRVSNHVRALALVLAAMTVIVPSGQPVPLAPGEFHGSKPSRVVTWQTKRLAPPSSLYVTVDDVLRVVAASSAANEVVTVNYRLLRAADGAVVVGQFTLKVPSIFPNSSVNQPLAEGFLLSVSCQAAQAVTRGQTFVRVMLNPKVLGSGQPGSMLMADYVTTAAAPGYPNGRIVSSVEGPGNIHAVQYATPGTGHDWGETDGLNTRRRLIQVTAKLTTSATVVNRVPQFQVLDNLLNVVGTYWNNEVQTANSPFFWTWSAAPVANVGVSSVQNVGLPPGLILPNGYSIQVTTTGLDTNAATGDKWTLIFATYEEWLDNV
jgi:hypothetical protein